MKIHNPFRVALLATLGVGVGLLVIGSVQNLSTILLYVGTALFLSLGLDPVVSFLERRGLPRWAAVLLTILGVLGIFAGIILMVVPIIVSQITQLVGQIEQLLQPGRWNEIVADVQDWATMNFPWLRIDEVWAGVQNWFTTLDVGSISTMVGNSLLTIGGAVAAGIGGAFIVLILTIYFTASTPSLKSAVYQLVPASRRARFIELAEKITDSVGYYVMGQVSLGVINGILSAIFLTIIDAPFPAVLAVIAFFFSLIPLVGTLTGSTIIVLTCPLLLIVQSDQMNPCMYYPLYYLGSTIDLHFSIPIQMSIRYSSRLGKKKVNLKFHGRSRHRTLLIGYRLLSSFC